MQHIIAIINDDIIHIINRNFHNAGSSSKTLKCPYRFLNIQDPIIAYNTTNTLNVIISFVLFN